MWFECAPGSKIIDGQLVDPVPPSTEDVEKFLQDLRDDNELRARVWHRFVLTQLNYKNIHNWAKKQFFFRNATKQQLERFTSNF